MTEASTPKPKKKLPFWLILLLSMLLTCIVSNVLTISWELGLLTTWQSLGNPPSGGVKIITADPYHLWVEANDGNVYTLSKLCYKNENCEKWLLVDDPSKNIPTDSKEYHQTLQWGSACNSLDKSFPGNPWFGKVKECVRVHENGPDPEFSFTVLFALMSDGSIKYWSHGFGLNFMVYFFFVCSVVFPILVAILVSVVYLIILIVRRIQRAVNSKKHAMIGSI